MPNPIDDLYNYLNDLETGKITKSQEKKIEKLRKRVAKERPEDLARAELRIAITYGVPEGKLV